MTAHHLVDQHRLPTLAQDMLTLQENTRIGAVSLDGVSTLSDWSIIKAHWQCLTGLAHGHPKLGTGRVYTTTMVLIDTELGWARTFNTLYRLEAPADDVARLLLSKR